jgi:PAS domain S-box-containing protein
MDTTIIKIKKIKGALFFVFVILIILGFFYLKKTWNDSTAETANHAMIIAETAGEALNGEMLKQLHAMPTDVGTVAYESIKNRLINLRTIDKNIRFAYIWIQRGEKIYFLADSELSTSKDYSPPGQEFTEAGVQSFQPFVDGQNLITKPYTDRWGSWVSIFVPMKDSVTGEIRAVFGIDYPAKYWNQRAIYDTTRSAIIIFVIFILLIIVFFYVGNIITTKEIAKKLQNILSGTNAGTWEWNIQTGKTEFDERWAELIGYKIKELEPTTIKTLEKFIHPDDLEQAKESLQEYILGKTPKYISEFRMKHKNGSWVWIYDSGKIIERDKKGNPLKMYGAHTDITELKRAQEAGEKLAAIVKNSNEAIIGKDLDGIISEWNEGAEKMYGFKANEVIGKNIKILAPQDKYSEIDAILKRTAQGEKINHFPTIRLRKDGTKIDVSISISPIKNTIGKIIGLSTITMDITKEREIDKAKTEFVSLASHQLRTPLTAINWYIEMLLAGDAGKISTKQKQYLNEVGASTKRMAELVSSLLNVSRLDLGTFAIEPTPIDVVALTKDVIKEEQPQIIEKKLQIKETYGKNVPLFLADSKLFRIILQNLFSNAVKYTNENGSVKLNIAALKKGELFDSKTLTEDSLTISIADSGIGIPFNQQSRIFTKLFRADNVAKLTKEGTGLGLYIVKSIIDQSGGSIWFESQENKGTTFYVSFALSGMKKKEGLKELS